MARALLTSDGRINMVHFSNSRGDKAQAGYDEHDRKDTLNSRDLVVEGPEWL